MNPAIYYTGDNPDALQFLQSQLTTENRLIPLEDLKQLDKVQYLLIISPTKIDLKGSSTRWIDTSYFWEAYLLDYYPNIRLMNIGYWSCDRMSCENYRDILDLGDWQTSLVSSSFPTLEQVYAEEEVLEDRLSEWDIKHYLKRFTDGHNRQGFCKYLTALKHTMTVAYDEYNALEDEYKWDYETIENESIRASGQLEWEQMLERWQFYKPFLKHTPFQKHLKEVESAMQKLSVYFQALKTSSIDLSKNEALFEQGNFEVELEKIDHLLTRHLLVYL
ncbi:MAG: hypothetical protein R3E32_25255 [Chitinophagales bacterium]